MQIKVLINKQLETYRWVLSVCATDSLMLQHQAISAHSAEYMDLLNIHVNSISKQNYCLKKAIPLLKG